MAPTVMFCVGATKAGTSWLYRYLHDHPECHIRSVKELHFYNTLDWNNQGYRFQELESEKARIKGELETREPGSWHFTNALRMIGDLDELRAVYDDPETAEEKYRDYMLRDAGEKALVADLTPAYGLLSKERLLHMAEAFPTSRFVYLLRDPVGRLWSHCRMMAARRGDDHRPHVDQRRAGNILERVLKGGEPEIVKRSDYAAVLEKLKALPQDRVLISFYEELFTPAEINRISTFLGIGAAPAPFEDKVFAGRPAPLEQDRKEAAARHLAPQYEAVRAHMGRVPEKWLETMGVAG